MIFICCFRCADSGSEGDRHFDFANSQILPKFLNVFIDVLMIFICCFRCADSGSGGDRHFFSLRKKSPNPSRSKDAFSL